MIWVAVFQSSLLFESSRGTLKMEVVCVYKSIHSRLFCDCVEGNILIAFWFEMRSWNGGGTGFGVT